MISALAGRAKAEGASSDDLLTDAAHLLMDQARIVEGEAPTSPVDFARRLGTVMSKAFNI